MGGPALIERRGSSRPLGRLRCGETHGEEMKNATIVKTTNATPLPRQMRSQSCMRHHLLSAQ
jgi:hypothetical protein